MSKIHKPVDAIRHDNTTRATIPTTELAGSEAGAVGAEERSNYDTFRHDFDRGRDPELFWLGKYGNDDEQTQRADLRVDIRSLYVHEQIQPEQLINNLYRIHEQKRVDEQVSLFDHEGFEATNVVEDELAGVTEYYRHTDKWKNRLIQGDSLLVMNSLLGREGMAGKVQCIYMDPPYGIKYGSNWQMKLNSRDVKDNDQNVSGEPEMIKAFRDTWELGIHSYLSYLRDRLVLARELLSESGSVFVQISDENVHLVRNIMDEVFGSENFVSQIIYTKTSGATSNTLGSVADFIIWYAKDIEHIKFRRLFIPKEFGEEGSDAYKYIELSNGERLSIVEWERKNGCPFDYNKRPKGSKIYRLSDLTSQTGSDSIRYPIEFQGQTYTINTTRGWRTSKEGMNRIINANRVVANKNSLNYVLYLEDFPVQHMSNLWPDTG
ncbi:MAG: site-specific DNA-methyltransferase, partial [Bacteroidales bacterium]|nr:site-specific DNA-methyltransferase [Bacteroidales bacterium]